MKLKNDQLELSLQSQIVCRSIARRQRRLNRASAWFDRMRQVVDDAVDFQPAPTPRSHPLWLINS